MLNHVAQSYESVGKHGQECDVVVDWSKLLADLHTLPQPDKSNLFTGFRAHFVAVPDGETNVTFVWPNTVPDGARTQIESGMKMMLGGFYQSYWGFANTDFLTGTKGSETKQIWRAQRLQSATYVLTQQSGNTEVNLSVSSEYRPILARTHSPATDAKVTFTIGPSAGHPENRLIGLAAEQHVGNNVIDGEMHWDYQDVSGTLVPQHLQVGITGAFSLNMTFAACALTTPAGSSGTFK